MYMSHINRLQQCDQQHSFMMGLAAMSNLQLELNTILYVNECALCSEKKHIENVRLGCDHQLSMFPLLPVSKKMFHFVKCSEGNV